MYGACSHSAVVYSGGLNPSPTRKLLPQPRLGLIKVTSPSVCFNEGGTGDLAVVVGRNPFPVISV